MDQGKIRNGPREKRGVEKTVPGEEKPLLISDRQEMTMI